MKQLLYIGFCILLLNTTTVFAQATTAVPNVTVKDTLKSTSNNIDPLTPAKAAFFSAILPGLGQAYNKKYWKIPLVYGAIGTSLYFYLDSNKKYHQPFGFYHGQTETRRVTGKTGQKWVK